MIQIGNGILEQINSVPTYTFFSYEDLQRAFEELYRDYKPSFDYLDYDIKLTDYSKCKRKCKQRQKYAEFLRKKRMANQSER